MVRVLPPSQSMARYHRPGKGTGSDEKDLWRQAQLPCKEKCNSVGGGGLIPERGDVRKARKTCKIRTDLKTK